MNSKTIQKIDNIFNDEDINYLLNHPEVMLLKTNTFKKN